MEYISVDQVSHKKNLWRLIKHPIESLKDLRKTSILHSVFIVLLILGFVEVVILCLMPPETYIKVANIKTDSFEKLALMYNVSKDQLIQFSTSVPVRAVMELLNLAGIMIGINIPPVFLWGVIRLLSRKEKYGVEWVGILESP